MKRRDWMGMAGLAWVGSRLQSKADTVAGDGVKLPPVVIDAHTHFYDPQREGGVPWPKKGSPLYRPVYPKDWREVAEPCGVNKTVVVEASPWLEDNQWILDLAAKDEAGSIIGFIGNVNPMTEQFEQHVRALAANRIFRGIRVSGNAFTDFCNEEMFVNGMKLLEELELTLDVNGGNLVLQELVKLVPKVPNLRVVINHVGLAGDPARLKDEWKNAMKAAAEVGMNVYCKVSALPEQAKMKEWGSAPTDLEYYRPILDWVWDCFGENRLIYGSDWPVSDRGTSYEKLFAMVRKYFAEKGQRAVDKYFYNNIVNAYSLDGLV